MDKDKSFEKARQRMLQYDLRGRDIHSKHVLEAIEYVRREEFVLQRYQSQAYEDGPLPIGMGQTISQPYIVALMTQELKVDLAMEVLEIGTGSGYQTAVLAKIAKRVYTVERFNQLSELSQTVLGRLGIRNVEFYIGDGSCGWPGRKVFDRIIVTAAVPKVPQPLVKKLKAGGLMVIPVGSESAQRLMVYEKQKNDLIEKFICDVRFVRLVGKHAFAE
ncbi:MAG: protein-L-isoaspartate(D-aspartate) O-methyltransferase [Planctomycetota bacterium]